MRYLGLLLAAFIFGCSSLPAAAPAPEYLPKIKYRVINTEGSHPLERMKLECAVKILNKVVNTADFQQRVLDAKFTEMGGYENWQILSKMVNGLPMMGGHTTDLNFIMYRDNKSPIIAYVYFVIPHRVWMNRKYWHHNELYMAATILHESMHLHGFRHDKEWATSVPYHIEDVFLESASVAFRYNEYKGECINEGISDFGYLYPLEGPGEERGEGPFCSGAGDDSSKGR